jgi:hypothetical protein
MAVPEQDDRIVVVTLTSCTVFWAELGYRESDRARHHAANIFDSEIGPWLEANSKHKFNAHTDGVWFLDQQDAALFKLMFHGRFDA